MYSLLSAMSVGLLIITHSLWGEEGKILPFTFFSPSRLTHHFLKKWNSLWMLRTPYCSCWFCSVSPLQSTTHLELGWRCLGRCLGVIYDGSLVHGPLLYAQKRLLYLYRLGLVVCGTGERRELWAFGGHF